MTAGTFAHLRILVVEDDAATREALVRMLRMLGVRSLSDARNGRDALARLPAVDIVLCDLDMPEMDGMELIRHVAAAEPRPAVVIVSAIGSALLEMVRKMARAYGVDLLAVIEKPVRVEAVRTALARRAVPQPAELLAAASPFTLEQIQHGVRAGQFEAYFQPRIDLATQRVVGAEALARWRHPEDGVLPPATFIDVLEKARQIEGLTLAILEQSARACRRWREHGHDFTVSVNLSLVPLADPALAGRLVEVLERAGLDPRHVVLEVTETAATEDCAPALENLVRLRLRGCGISIDDYGTGFASLERLTRIPLTELKIDRSFVADLPESRVARVVVESSIDMARRLGARSVAEGVETAACRDALQAAGCEQAQGYYFARPLEADAFAAFCARAARAHDA